MMLICLALASTSWATNYYVDKNNTSASDSNPGTQSSPWKTIQKAANTVRAGDVVYVKSGVYYEQVNIISSGTSSNPITFKSYTKNGAVIDGSKSSSIVVNWKGNGSPHDWVVLDGFEIRNGSKYGVWVEGDHDTVQNCMIHDNGTPGAVGDNGLECHKTDYVNVLHNEVYNSGWDGISIGTSTNGTVEYNNVHDNPDHNGINIMPSNADPQVPYQNNNVRFNRSCRNNTGIYMRWQQNNEISNNFLYDNNHNGIEITYYTGAGGSTYRSNTKIYNNTIANNGSYGIRDVSGTYLIIKNNIIASNGKDAINILGNVTTGHVIDYNLYNISDTLKWGSKECSSLSVWQSVSGQDSHSIQSNPGFDNLNVNSCAITANSKAVDSGTNLASEGINQDINGTFRPQGNGFDIGAFEYSSGQVYLNPPTNLRVQN